jgi:hypothetical protein
MTVTLHLNPELEAGLLAQAQARGKSVEDFLVSMVEGVVQPAAKALTSDQRADAFEAWSASHRLAAPLSDYAVSREGIYEGRDG